jgi:Tfp pilus assembly protein PilO
LKENSVFILAFEYEKLQGEEEFLEEFFQSSAKKVQSDIVQQWLKQLIQCRSSGKQFQLPSDSNLNTMLKHILYDDQGLNFIFFLFN